MRVSVIGFTYEGECIRVNVSWVDEVGMTFDV